MKTNLMPRINRVSRRILRRAQYPLDQWLIDLSAVRHPGPSRKTAFRTVSGIRQGLMLYLEGMEGGGQIWVGEEIDTGRPMRVAYLGDSRAIRFHAPEYLQHILFRPDTVVVTPLESFAMLRVGRQAEQLAEENDLVITDGNGSLPWRPPYGRWVHTPNWIRMEFVLEPDETWEDIESRFRAHKNNIKRVQQNGFTYRVSHDEADFDLFYDQMYVPLITNRHAEYGAVDQKESMRKEFHDGFLFMIDDADGNPVAGQLTYVHNKTMYSINSGVLEGSKELHSKGALSAIYYFSIRWCFENGMERFEMGSCRPFETDGLYQYKLRWGMTPTPDLWGTREWTLWSPHNSPVADAWLYAHPVVSLDAYWHGAAPEPDGNQVAPETTRETEAD